MLLCSPETTSAHGDAEERTETERAPADTEPAAADEHAEAEEAAPREIQILETAEDIQGRREQVREPSGHPWSS